MSDQPSGRDEKGLTISGRTMLRLLTKFGETMLASRKLGDKAGFELIQTPTILLEVRALLWIASQMSKRIGTKDEIEAYLRSHEKADEKVVQDGITEAGKAILEEVIAHGDLKRCTCGELICPTCQECHACLIGTEHATQKPPEGETLN